MSSKKSIFGDKNAKNEMRYTFYEMRTNFGFFLKRKTQMRFLHFFTETRSIFIRYAVLSAS